MNNILEDEHEFANALGCFGVAHFQIVENGFLGGAIRAVENLGERFDATREAEVRRHDRREFTLQNALDFAQNFGVGTVHIGDARGHVGLHLGR